MANNRMYIRCMVCGERIYIGKSFLSGYSAPLSFNVDALNDFFDEHAYCHKGDKLDVTSDGLFEIVYELKENEYMKDIY